MALCIAALAAYSLRRLGSSWVIEIAGVAVMMALVAFVLTDSGLAHPAVAAGGAAGLLCGDQFAQIPASDEDPQRRRRRRRAADRYINVVVAVEVVFAVILLVLLAAG